MGKVQDMPYEILNVLEFNRYDPSRYIVLGS